MSGLIEQLFKVDNHRLPAQHIRQYHRATIDAQDTTLHIAIKQYTPLDNPKPKPGDITIIGAHANGFPKELYEPLWIELLKRSKRSGFRIRNIWIADASHQGQSGVLNEGKLGDDPSWFDHSRDLLHMVNTFRDQIQRPIIGIGHSMGGAHLINLSLMHHRLFTTLILIDPVVQSSASARGTMFPARSSASRRDVWPSRAEARAAFSKSKFYQTWDPRVLELWIQHGLRDMPTLTHPIQDSKQAPKKTDSVLPPITAEPTLTPKPAPPVTLTTTRHQEVFTFLRPNFPPLSAPNAPGPHTITTTNPGPHDRVHIPDLTPHPHPQSPFYRPESHIIFANLPYLRPSVLYIFGEKSDLSAAVNRAEKMASTGTGPGGSGGVAEGKVKEYLMPGVGHLIPMENVGGTADQCADWIAPVLDQWKKDEVEVLRSWEGRPREERYQLGQRYLEMVNGPLRGLPAAKPRGAKSNL